MERCGMFIDSYGYGTGSMLYITGHCEFSVLSACHAPVAREFAKKGCPTSMRGELWCQMLGIEVDEVVHSLSFLLR